MAAGGEPRPQRRPRRLGVPAKPASAQRRAAQLSPPEPSGALPVRWAVAGPDGQRVSPMAGSGGQRGAGRSAAGGPGPAHPLPCPPPPSLPRAPRPDPLPGSHFPPTRFAGRRGSAGMEPSLPGPDSRPLLSQVRSAPRRGRLPFLSVSSCHRGPRPPPRRAEKPYKELGVWVHGDSGCVTLSKRHNLSAAPFSASLKRRGRRGGGAIRRKSAEHGAWYSPRAQLSPRLAGPGASPAPAPRPQARPTCARERLPPAASGGGAREQPSGRGSRAPVSSPHEMKFHRGIRKEMKPGSSVLLRPPPFLSRGHGF